VSFSKMSSPDRSQRSERRRSLSSSGDRSRARRQDWSARSTSPRRRGRDQSLDSSSSYSSSLRSRSRSRSRSSRRSRRRKPQPEPEKRGAIAAIKDAAPLLATIGVASFVAHKFWPKGVLFGDPDDWEKQTVVERRAKTVLRDEEGGVRHARHVTERNGKVVVNDIVRREPVPASRERRDWRDDDGGRSPRRLQADRSRYHAVDPPSRRPASAYLADERQYRRPSPSVAHDRRDYPSSAEQRHDFGYEDRYGDARYVSRAPRPRSYYDEPQYDYNDRR
jgi:hypothetical protein